MEKRYKKMIRQNSLKLIIVTTLCALIITVAEFISPIIVKDFIDNFEARKEHITISISIIIFVFIASYLLKILGNSITNHYAIKFKTAETLHLYKIMFQMKYSELVSKEPTYIVEKINNSVNTLFVFFSEAISTYVISTISVLISILFVYQVDFFITCLFLVLIPLQLIGYKILNTKLNKKCKTLQTVCAKGFKDILSVTSSIEYYKQSPKISNVLNLLKPFVTSIISENVSVNKFAGFVSITLSDITNIINNCIYIVASVYMITNRITLSELIFVNMILTIYIPAIRRLINANINIRDLDGVYDFIENEMLVHIEEEGKKDLKEVNVIEGNIEPFYYNEKEVLKGGSFYVEKGDIVFLSGLSGSGKTTLVKGLVKFHLISNIKINGVNIEQYSNESVRNKISFYSQNIPIITGTIRDNIRMGAEGNEAELDKLREKSFMKKFFALEKGLDTVILENGANLSGGDKQKIALARLYLEHPDVIILDESTSSLDKETAYEIMNDIIENYKDKIIFIISHDKDIIKYTNKMIEIDNGYIQSRVIK